MNKQNKLSNKAFLNRLEDVNNNHYSMPELLNFYSLSPEQKAYLAKYW